MLSDLNFYPTNEKNYTTEQPNGSNFLAGIFSTYDQTNSYPTYDQTNFYPTYDQTNSYLYPAVYSNNIIYQQPNPAVPPYNFFDDSTSTSYCNLADDLGRTKEQSNIDGSSSVDLTVIELSDDHDDQDEQDDGGPYYWSEIEILEDYTEQSDISIDESEDEEIQICDTTLLVTR
jgi:hypothetical protein